MRSVDRARSQAHEFSSSQAAFVWKKNHAGAVFKIRYDYFNGLLAVACPTDHAWQFSPWQPWPASTDGSTRLQAWIFCRDAPWGCDADWQNQASRYRTPQPDLEQLVFEWSKSITARASVHWKHNTCVFLTWQYEACLTMSNTYISISFSDSAAKPEFKCQYLYL